MQSPTTSSATPVSIHDDTIVVGAIHDDTGGSAYVFSRDATWTQQAKLTTDDAVYDEWFGDSVSISGDTAPEGTSASIVVTANVSTDAVLNARIDFNSLQVTEDQVCCVSGFGSSTSLCELSAYYQYLGESYDLKNRTVEPHRLYIG